MGINNSPAYPKDNPMALFTGTDDSAYTRRVARWLNQEYISVKRFDYDTVSQLSDRYNDPWNARVYLDGTDGMTFHPNI